MSARSLKRNMVLNQKINNHKLSKLSNNLSFKEIRVGATKDQEEVAVNTQNTLRSEVDRTIFMKSDADKEFVKVMKVRTKDQLK